MKKTGINVSEEFRPALQYRTLYYIYFLALILLFFLTPVTAILIFAPLIVKLMFFTAVTILLLFVAYWIPAYYDTVIYKLTNSEIVWRRGVWFRNTGIVPYNRITNVDISQGPVSRMLGISSLHIQTAGYSGQNKGFGNTAEIKLEGIEQSEELREMIIGFVRGRKPVAVETYDADSSVLNELVRIRKLLEKRK